MSSYSTKYPNVHTLAIRSVETGRLVMLPIVQGTLIYESYYNLLRGRLDEGTYRATLATEEGDVVTVPAHSLAFMVETDGTKRTA